MLSDNPEATQKVIAERMDISIVTVKRIVKSLSDKKIIERIGSKKKGY